MALSSANPPLKTMLRHSALEFMADYKRTNFHNFTGVEEKLFEDHRPSERHGTDFLGPRAKGMS